MKILQESQTQLILQQNSYGTIIWALFSIVVGAGILLLIHQNTVIIKVFGAAFVLLGIGLIVTAKFITITIDKTQNQFTFQATGILGKKTQPIALNQIKEVSLEEYITQNLSNNTGPRNQLNFTLVFYLQDGQSIPIPLKTNANSFSANGFPLGGFLGRNKNVVMGNKIAEFIGVPFVDRRPPTVGEIVQGITQNINTQKQMNETPPLPKDNQQLQ